MILRVLSYIGTAIVGACIGTVTMSLCILSGKQRDDECSYKNCEDISVGGIDKCK